MNYEFTSAAERVLHHATGWIDPAGSFKLDSSALLLGLLNETECRAAHLLAQYGVTIQDVCDAWGISQNPLHPTERIITPPYHFHSDLNRAIREVYRFALEFERAPSLATEHLLLALLYSDNETTQWLIKRGADPQTLEADIRARNGYVNTPLDIEEEAEEDSEEGEEEVKADNEDEEIVSAPLRHSTFELRHSIPPSPFRLPPPFSASSMPPPIAPAKACGPSKTICDSCWTTAF